MLVRLKDSVLDPQGEAILRALKSQGQTDYLTIRVGKLIELTLCGDGEEAVTRRVNLLADELLANPVMENYVVSVKRSSI
ncbi:MAG: phosphoribosylformylglycinamidine synthase subunit PurS [Deltaproteobacteria bacterium]|nr:phosphoribosylformylglycinamidine synthase subunit PurS [Deltaproteobacteria bacterium]